VRRGVEKDDVRVLEKEICRHCRTRHDLNKEIAVRECRSKIGPHLGTRRKDACEKVPGVKDSLNHARAAFVVPCPSFFSAGVCCCFRQRRKSASLQSTISSAEFTT